LKKEKWDEKKKENCSKAGRRSTSSDQEGTIHLRKCRGGTEAERMHEDNFSVDSVSKGAVERGRKQATSYRKKGEANRCQSAHRYRSDREPLGRKRSFAVSKKKGKGSGKEAQWGGKNQLLPLREKGNY